MVNRVAGRQPPAGATPPPHRIHECGLPCQLAPIRSRRHRQRGICSLWEASLRCEKESGSSMLLGGMGCADQDVVLFEHTPPKSQRSSATSDSSRQNFQLFYTRVSTDCIAEAPPGVPPMPCDMHEQAQPSASRCDLGPVSPSAHLGGLSFM